MLAFSAVLSFVITIWLPKLLFKDYNDPRRDKYLGELKEWDCFQLGWKYNGGRTFVILPLEHQPGGEIVRVMDLGMRSGDIFDLSRTLPIRKVFSLAPRCQESVLRDI
jgi:hypothetical protein